MVYTGGGDYEYEHRVIVERALKRPLAPLERVGRIWPSRKYEKGNTVVCPNEAYLKIIQRRARALKCSGDARKRLCCYCGTWDYPLAMRGWDGKGFYHGECHCFSEHLRKYREPRPEKGAVYRDAALTYSREVSERRAASRQRQRDRAGGKVGGTKRIRRSDASGGAIRRFSIHSTAA